MFSHNVVQNAPRNLVSLFDMILLNIPNCTHTYSKNLLVSSCLLTIFLQGMRMHNFLNLSTTTNRYSSPFLIVGNPPKNIWKCFPKFECVQVRDRIYLDSCCLDYWYNTIYTLYYIMLHLLTFWVNTDTSLSWKISSQHQNVLQPWRCETL
jgi:dolichol kinase